MPNYSHTEFTTNVTARKQLIHHLLEESDARLEQLVEMEPMDSGVHRQQLINEITANQMLRGTKTNTIPTLTQLITHMREDSDYTWKDIVILFCNVCLGDQAEYENLRESLKAVN